MGRAVGLTKILTIPRAFHRCLRGVAAVEFALAATPLLFIVFGFFATNMMFYTLSAMQNSAQFAVTMLATGRATTTSTGGIAVPPVSCDTHPNSPTAEYFACTGTMLPGWATFVATSSEDCSVPKVSVTMTVNASSAAMADVYHFFSNDILTTTAVAMKQGSCP